MSIKDLLYPLADALEMDFTFNDGGLAAQKVIKLNLFEGYSPTILSTIIESLTHFSYGTVGVLVQIWGNLHIVMLNEDAHKRLLLFVLDKQKITETNPDDSFFPNNKWSRSNLYRVMEPGVRAIYHRQSYAEKWEKLDNGPARIRKYNEARKNQMDSKMAWNLFWGDGAV